MEVTIERSISPYRPRIVSDEPEPTLGHLRCHLADVPPQPNFQTDRCSTLCLQGRATAKRVTVDALRIDISRAIAKPQTVGSLRLFSEERPAIAPQRGK